MGIAAADQEALVVARSRKFVGLHGGRLWE
jgi:hypothetical protein